MGPPCEDSVSIHSRETARDIQIIAVSDCHVPLWVEVDFPILNNAEPLGELPARAAVPAYGSEIVTRLRTRDPEWPWGYQASINSLFGEGAPAPVSTTEYAFPFGGEIPRELAQGAGGAGTHVGLNHFSYDFAMPVGTPVLAARDGWVLSVRDGFGEGANDPAFRDRANQVMVLHDDGTVALYGHLSKGIPVDHGDRISVGDLLGISGNSGYSSGPHLHFQVSVQRRRQEPESIPIRFRGQTRLETGRVYGPGRAR